MKRATQETQGLYWSRPPLWCNTLLQFVAWWIAYEADEKQYKGRTASRGSVLGWCDELLGGVQSPLSLSVSDASRLFRLLMRIPLPCGWLVLFIGEGPGPLPKY